MWDGGPIPGELGKFPGYLMARLGEASRRRFHKALEPEGLHPRDFGVMTMVDAHPGMSQQQLHEKTGIDPSSMVAVIDELEARGLAERRANPDDRRARTIFLTDEGERTLERIRKLATQLQRELFGGLTPEELSTLHGLLRKLADSTNKQSASAAAPSRR
ncbi:MAG TPA: MarR family transcriptional regulator [Solirubrobacteraceae bacterium]|jgi:DNA-binding MarR family transcriptional regulator|nr:MarR family transcriptional regulator [Solirubrobacteraceae bacterium]